MIRELFERVLQEYPSATGEPLEGHPLAAALRDTIPAAFLELPGLEGHYVIKGSPGAGNWARIPWVAVFDPAITTSATRGLYIVYLFRSDAKGVYVSLNQGWTEFEEKYGRADGLERIHETATLLSRRLADIPFHLRTFKVDLGPDLTALGRGYEAGHICGRYYPAGAIPPDDGIASDLTSMLALYRDLRPMLLSEDLPDVDPAHSDEEVVEGAINPGEDKSALLSAALAFIQTGPHHVEGEQKRRRRESRRQKERIARLEDYTCQVCGWSMTWTDRLGRPRRYIHIDHIQDKAGEHGEECENLWALCPNCHAKKTFGLISIDSNQRQVLVDGHPTVIRDHHLWIDEAPSPDEGAP